uniref:Uncharacterized protein n=1 Tax=Sphenodon punctatus TaxID=8508 RepID=A0A8D0H408_SPHPU
MNSLGGGHTSLTFLRSPQGTLTCSQTLHGTSGNGLGRFGAALASLGDITGDGIGDVAVGAPMEDNNQGAVYIFLGGEGGIRDPHSQRIAGRSYSLHFFGQSVQGRLDVSGDGLTDLAVGALGAAGLFRSRPVFRVFSSLRFSPDRVPQDGTGCWGDRFGTAVPRGNVTLCFALARIGPRGTLGPLRARVTFNLQVDANQTRPRLKLESEASAETIRVGITETCLTRILQASVTLPQGSLLHGGRALPQGSS